VTTGTAAQYAEVERAYGKVAHDYDALVGMAPSAARARAAALARVTRAAPPGARLLDVGSGTGADALALARKGYHVVGVDSAPEMVAEAQRRAAASGRLRGSAAFATMRAADVGGLRGRFDAAFSYYAVLNLEPRLEDAARGVASLLPEGATFLVCLLNPTALFELALYPLAGRLKGYRKAAQRPVRLKLATGGEADVACYLYSPGAFARRLAPWFELREVVGLHLLLPPPRGAFLRLAPLYGALNRVEQLVESRAPFNRLGYFSLLTFARTSAPA